MAVGKGSEKTILQPENNLLCGVKIMKAQLVNRRKPLVSSASYWSTLQPGTISYKVFKKQMANVPEVCRVAPVIETKIDSKTPSATENIAASTAAVGTIDEKTTTPEQLKSLVPSVST